MRQPFPACEKWLFKNPMGASGFLWRRSEYTSLHPTTLLLMVLPLDHDLILIFVVSGGGAIYFPPLREDEFINTGIKLEDIAADYMRSHKVYHGKIENKIRKVSY